MLQKRFVRPSVCVYLSIVSLFIYLCACVFLPVCPYVCLSVCLYGCLPVSFKLSICLSDCLCLSVCLSFYLSICLSIDMYAWLSVHLSACPSICLSINMSAWLSVPLSACVFLTVCLLICMSVCLPVSVCPSTRPPVLPSVCLSVFLSFVLWWFQSAPCYRISIISTLSSTVTFRVSVQPVHNVYRKTQSFFKQKGFEIFPEIHKNLIRGRIYRISNRKMVSMDNSSQDFK